MPVKGSHSFVWFSEQKLGSGCLNGQYYFGRNKTNGSACVVGILRTVLSGKTIEKIKGIKSQNIVKFLAAEEESKSKQPIFVFEFCNEQSLYQLLEKPENIYGLDDQCVLNFHRDVCRGLKVLQHFGMAGSFHLKPSNVLCMRDSNDNLLFKLSDYFHDSYSLSENLYCISDLKRLKSSINILVWSLGAILCHVILGSSPFFYLEQGHSNKTSRSKGCLDNKQSEHIFITKLKGELIWQKKFPLTVQLSQSLQENFAYIIKECLNIQRQVELKHCIEYKSCTFKYEDLLYIFQINDLSHLAFIRKHDKIYDIRKTSAFQFGKDTDILVCDYKILKRIDELSFYGLSKENPAYYLHPLKGIDLSEYDEMLSRVFDELKSVLEDAVQDDFKPDVMIARQYSGFSILCLRIFEKILLGRRALKQISDSSIDLINDKLKLIKTKYALTSEDDDLRNYEEGLKNLREVESEIGFSQDDSGYHSSSVTSKNCQQRCCHGFLKELADQISQTYETFLEDLKRDKVVHNDKQVHKYEKYKLKENAKKACHILTRHCITQYREDVECFIKPSGCLEQYKSNLTKLESRTRHFSAGSSIADSDYVSLNGSDYDYWFKLNDELSAKISTLLEESDNYINQLDAG